MPLQPASPQKIVISDFEGIDVERGKLVRAVGSFQSLVNYDLVKPGVIRKVRGNFKLNTNNFAPNDWIIGFSSYQATPASDTLIVFVAAFGGVYKSVVVPSGLITFVLIGNVYNPVDGPQEEVPYLVSLPFTLPDGTNQQFLIITFDDRAEVQKFDGTSLTRLGIPNPGDSFTVPYQHSVAIPQLLYADTLLSADIYLYSSPNQNQGIPVSTGKQYRAAWYNSKTGHTSSLFPLSLDLWPTAYNTAFAPNPSSLTKQLGTLVNNSAAPYVMAVPMFLDNLPDRKIILPVTDPQEDYDSLRIFVTKDGDATFYLLPIVYDNFGKVISDENGAISLSGLKYGFQNYSDTSILGFSTPIYDGYVPLKLTAFGSVAPPWFAPVLYNDVIQYTVSGAGQTGNTLNVLRSVSPNSVKIVTGLFTLQNDAVVYRITASSFGGDPTDVWTIDPPIVNAPPDGSTITINFIRPVQDFQLLTQFNSSTELPFDRVNDPPPRASWGAVFQGRLFLLSVDKTTIFYSRIEDYESFPPDNFFKFTEADFAPVTALIGSRQVGLVSQGADQRLIVAKQQSSYQITGTSILDFAVTGLFPETGVVHKNAAAVIGGFTAILSRQGIEIVQGQTPTFIGTKIKDIVDEIELDEYGPVFTLERKDYQIIMGVNLGQPISPFPQPQVTSIILMREPRTGSTAEAVQREGFISPFSQIFPLPGVMAAIQEIGFSQNAQIMMTDQHGDVWQLFKGGESTPGVPVIAEAISQELPQDNREMRKLFRKVRFDGNEVNDDPGWQIAYSVDDSDFTPDIQMYEENLVGMVGRFLRVRIRHVRSVDDSEFPPQLSNMEIEYAMIGDSRGYANA